MIALDSYVTFTKRRPKGWAVPRDEVDGETVGQTDPGEEGLFEPALEQVGDQEDGGQQPHCDARGVVEEGVAAESGRHVVEEQSRPRHTHQQEVHMFPVERDAVRLGVAHNHLWSPLCVFNALI